MGVLGRLRVAKEHRAFYCPGCEEYHMVRVSGPQGAWGFNGDHDNPTFTPSVLVTGYERLTDEEYARVLRKEEVERRPLVCHSFVTDGRIQFLNDCTHRLAGQTLELPDLDDL